MNFVRSLPLLVSITILAPSVSVSVSVAASSISLDNARQRRQLRDNTATTESIPTTSTSTPRTLVPIESREDQPLVQQSSSTSTSTSASTSASISEAAVPISFVGINYNTRKGPDWAADAERCKTREEIVRDLTLLSRITNKIRLLSINDCKQGELVRSVLENELKEQNTTMQLWLGLWVGQDPNGFAGEVAALEDLLREATSTSTSTSTILSNNQLLGVSVGSEAIYRKEITVEEAIANLDTVRALLKEYRVDVPAAIVDIAPIYSNSQALRLASDVIMTNTFPFWEGTPIEEAIDELDEDLQWLLQLPESEGKRFVLGEHGWPSEGYNADVAGIASPQNQQRYMAESFCYVRDQGWEYYVFTGIDNAWRQLQDPDNTIEGNWGFLDSDLKLKDHFVGFEFSCPDGTRYTFAGVDWSVPPLLEKEPVATNNASCKLWDTCQELAGDCCPTPNGNYLGCCREELFLGNNNNSNSDNNNNANNNDNDNGSAPTLQPSTIPSESIVVTVDTQAPSSKATIAVVTNDNVPTLQPSTTPSESTVVPMDTLAPSSKATTGIAAVTSTAAPNEVTSTTTDANTGKDTTTETAADGGGGGSPWNENGWDPEPDINNVLANNNINSGSSANNSVAISWLLRGAQLLAVSSAFGFAVV
mmetsp:Transcript_19700/g.41484  ORF Transcript_19700/g.41484 Transcript_19700/m.41484 type:complete len:649 (+) Transcript_19700:199-2145(+)